MEIQRLHIDVTGRCNCRCKHCHMADYYSKELDTNEILSVLRTLKVQGLQKIAISGGEPLLRKDIFQIIEESPNNISILTNSLLINKSLLNKFLEFKKRTNKIIIFRISLDGLESNEKIRGYSYKKVISQLKKIKRAGFIVVINTTISPFLQDNELMRMLFLLEQLQIDQWNVDIPFNEGSFRQNNLSIDLEKCLSKLKQLIIAYLNKELNMRLDVVGLFCSERIKKNIGFYECNLIDHPCNYQLHSITINPSGEILLCPSLHIPFGKIADLETYRSSEKWKEFIQKKRDFPKGCNNCKYIKICGGGCRANALYTRGELWEKDDLSCKLMEFLEKDLLSFYPLAIQDQFKKLLTSPLVIKDYSFQEMVSSVKELFLKIYPDNPSIVKKMSYDEKNIKEHISTKVAFENNLLVGQANIFMLNQKKKIANLGYHIHPDFRRRGVGESLSKEVILEAKTKGIKILVVRTEKQNLNALNLARKLGFIIPPEEFIMENKNILSYKNINDLVCLYKIISP